MRKKKLPGQEKDIKVFKSEIISDIARKLNLDKEYIRQFMWALEDVVLENLRRAEPDQDVSINLMTGMVLESKFVPEATRKNNLTGEMITLPDQVRAHCRVARKFQENLNKVGYKHSDEEDGKESE